MKRILRKLLSKFRPRLPVVPPHFGLNEGGRGGINFIDVGSVGGLPSPWDRHAGTINFLLNFEPNDQPRSGQDWMTYNTALWEQDAVLPFYVYKGFNATGSSLFEQNYDYVREHWEELKTRGPQFLADTWFDRSQLVATHQLRCRTLDNILAEQFLDRPFQFLKIDAQGAEMPILRGADKLLKASCVGLHLELFVVPLYRGIALMDEIVDHLAQLGFQLVKKYPAHGSFNSQHDCVFLHETRSPAISALIQGIYGL